MAGQVVTATITESTDPLQDGSLFSADGSMIGGLSHSWFRWDGVEGNDPVEIEGASSTLSQPDTSVEELKATYTPVADDVGKYLILTVVTPTGATGYQYLDKSSKTTDNAVIKGTPGAPTLAVESKTTSSLTVTAVEGAEYAILNQDGTALAADFDASAADANALAWQDSNEFTGLTPNTNYELYIRMKETDVDNASAYATLEAKTNAISIDPDDPSREPDPVVTFDTEPSVTISGDLKFGEQLTATLVDAVIKIDGVEVSGPFYTEYQWYRVTPAEGEGEASEEVIASATDTTYELTENDIGKTVTVKVTPAADSPYSGVVSDTTAEIAKADGPEAPTGITNSKKATNTETADGELDGLTSSMEYRLKTAEGEAEAEWTAISLAEGETALGGLAAGTYEIRFAETTTTKAGAATEVTVEVNGYDITGVVESYNAKNATTYTLYLQNEDGSVTEVASGTLVEAAETTEATTTTTAFTISGVANGTYRLVIRKLYQLSYTINDIEVNGGNVDLTSKSSLSVITLVAGDVTGDGVIESGDQSLVINGNNYFKNIDEAQNPEGDIDGDGIIESTDQGMILKNYFKSNNDFVVSFTALS